MNDPIRTVAFFSIARGCGFGSLAIVTAMLGLSYDPPGAARFGGFSWLFMCAVLLMMAFRAERRPFKRTEIWLMLAPELRPDSSVAQAVITRVRKRTLLEFARICAQAGALLLALALILPRG